MKTKGIRWCWLFILALCLFVPAYAGAESTGTEAPPLPETKEETTLAQPTEMPPTDAYTRAEILPYMQSTPASDFTLATCTGESVTLSDEKDRIVLLHFWTTWNTESLQGLQQCGKVAEKYGDVTVWAINSLPLEYGRDHITDADRVQMENWAIGFLSENGYSFQILFDVDGGVTRQYAGQRLPSTFFIDREGILRIPWHGSLSGQTMQTLMEMMYALDP